MGSAPVLQVFSSRRAVATSSSLCSQHGGWARRSPVDSPSRQSKKPLAIDCQSTSCLSQSSITLSVCSGSVYGGPSQLTTLTPPHLRSPLFPLEVAPSILQNAFRLASQLLRLLHFTSWLLSLSTPIPCSFFSDWAPPPTTLCLTFALESQTNGQSQTF